MYNDLEDLIKNHSGPCCLDPGNTSWRGSPKAETLFLVGREAGSPLFGTPEEQVQRFLPVATAEATVAAMGRYDRRTERERVVALHRWAIAVIVPMALKRISSSLRAIGLDEQATSIEGMSAPDMRIIHAASLAASDFRARMMPVASNEATILDPRTVEAAENVWRHSTAVLFAADTIREVADAVEPRAMRGMVTNPMSACRALVMAEELVEGQMDLHPKWVRIRTHWRDSALQFEFPENRWVRKALAPTSVKIGEALCELLDCLIQI